MRIGMIGHKRIPGREGGIEVVVEELATRMAARGNEIIVYNRKSKKHEMPLEYKGVRLINVPTIEKNLQMQLYILFSRQFMQSLDTMM